VNNLHIITLYELHNKLSACLASRARVGCVEPCCSTSSTQAKCMDSTCRTCRKVTSQVEFGL